MSSSFLLSIIKRSSYTKKEQKLISNVDNILGKAVDHTIWQNEDFWASKWPKIVDDCAEMIEEKSRCFAGQLSELYDVDVYLRGKTVSFEI